MNPTGRRSRPRPAIQTIFALLVVGAIINVVVAWGCAAEWSKPWWSFRRPATSDDLAWVTSYEERPLKDWISKSASGEIFMQESGRVEGSLGRERSFTYLSDSAFDAKQKTLLPAKDSGHWVQLIPQFTASRIRAGWPFRTFQDYRVVHSDDWKIAHPRAGLVDSSGALALPGLGPDGNASGPIIWSGFAMNTIFYAGVVWLLMASPRIPIGVRRRYRIKRGQCPACAYPIGTSQVCTECGGALPLPRVLAEDS